MKAWIITFGVQYDKAGQTPHPLRMHKDGYAVIQAPTEELARSIANAIFDKAWAMIYPADQYINRFQPDGELLRIAWMVDPANLQAEVER